MRDPFALVPEREVTEMKYTGVKVTLAADGPRYAHSGDTLIADVRVINGLGHPPLEHQDVLGRSPPFGQTARPSRPRELGGSTAAGSPPYPV